MLGSVLSIRLFNSRRLHGEVVLAAALLLCALTVAVGPAIRDVALLHAWFGACGLLTGVVDTGTQHCTRAVFREV